MMNGSGDPEIERRPNVDPKVVEAVVSALYPQLLAEPATARGRAQGAFSIASAIGAALAAGGLVVEASLAPIWLRSVGGAAVTGWIAAAGLFTIAAGYARKAEVKIRHLSAEDLVARSIESSLREADGIWAWLRRGVIATSIALGLTAATVIGFFFGYSESRLAEVTLATATLERLGDVCGDLTNPVVAEIKEADSPLPWEITLVDDRCDEEATLRVEAEALQMVRYLGV